MNKISLLALIGSDVGGVGKTTVSRAFYDFVHARGAAMRVVDCEIAGGGDLRRFIPSAEMVDISTVRGQMKIFDGSVDGCTVVDLPAGALSRTLHAVAETGLLDDVRGGAMNLALLHILAPSERSIAEIAEMASKIKGAKHFLIANDLGNEGGFNQRTANSQFSAQLRQMAHLTVHVPYLSADVVDAMQKAEVSFAAFMRDQTQSRTLRGLARSWLDRVFAGFEKVGLGELVSAAIPERSPV